LDVQILVAAAAQPAIKGPCLRAPPGMTPDDQNEFALALCDVVLVAPGSEQHPVARTAARLGKAVTAPGAALRLLTHKVFPLGLDPESPGWRTLGRINGRLEQAILELWAFGWFGWDKTGRTGCARSRPAAARSCFQRETSRGLGAPDRFRSSRVPP